MHRIQAPPSADATSPSVDAFLGSLNASPTLVLIAAVAMVAVLVRWLLRDLSGGRQRRWRRAVRRAEAVAYRPGTEGATPPVSAPRYTARPILNASERRLHAQLERLLPQHFHPDARLLAQVSLAEFIYAPDRDDFLPISAQRVDFLIVDRGFAPLCAIEYQGAGHHGADPHSQARTRTRDFIKRTALRTAGVPLIEIPDRYDMALLRARLGDVTGRRPADGPAGGSPAPV